MKRAPRWRRPLSASHRPAVLEQDDQQQDDEDEREETTSDIHALLLSNSGAFLVYARSERHREREALLPFQGRYNADNVPHAI
jgi:hypothetical protein